MTGVSDSVLVPRTYDLVTQVVIYKLPCLDWTGKDEADRKLLRWFPGCWEATTDDGQNPSRAEQRTGGTF